jgi:hypothetical protein
MSWNAYHSESERLAGRAEALLADGRYEVAADEYRGAAEAEERAFAALGPSRSRTRGITAVSAVSLWLKAGDLERVRALGARLLDREALPAFARGQIREILEDLEDAEIPAAAAQTR